MKRVTLHQERDYEIFYKHFNYTETLNDTFLIELDYNNLSFLIKRISEFAFQIIKLLSLEDEFDWNYDD